MIDDTELLRRYVRERSEAAFTELVQRKAGLVYSAALRQVGGDTLLAQDVAQGVFIDLARKAAQLVDRPELTSWLYASTRFAALKALRERHRRTHREQEAHTMQEIERDTLTDTEWQQLRPLLDEAIFELADGDRAAVLMRYFENQPFGAMGQKLGIGESSARMRAERALEKLRALLVQKGVTSTAAALALVLATRAVAAPPTGLATALAAAALTKSATTAAAGTGAAVKVYQALAANKLSSGAAVALTTTAAGVATYEPDQHVHSVAFFLYTVCFAGGLLFGVLSMVFGHLGHGEGGHADLAHDTDLHVHAHAEGGLETHEMPGFAPVGPTTIATFVTAFGGVGMLASQSAMLFKYSAIVAAVTAFGLAALVAWILILTFRYTQGTSEGRVGEVCGLSATIITPIAPGGVGEIAYVQRGSRYSAPARSEYDQEAFPNGATVTITRVAGAQFFVKAS